MKIHLEKNYKTMKGAQCTGNPFVKGRIVDAETFEKMSKEHPETMCRRCSTLRK